MIPFSRFHPTIPSNLGLWSLHTHMHTDIHTHTPVFPIHNRTYLYHNHDDSGGLR